MAQHPFKQVDVFTTEPYKGNPVAVVLDADDLDVETMQSIARWTNLSETTFVLRPTTPEADYRLRIFTPGGELPFAGHPTLGSAHAVLESGRLEGSPDELVQECGAGLLNLSIEGAGLDRKIFVKTPMPKLSPPLASPQANAVASALGGEFAAGSVPVAVDVGPVWLVAQMESEDTVHALIPDMAALDTLSRELKVTGVTVFGLSSDGKDGVYVRSFAPAFGVPEDPVCGSGNASVGAYLFHTELLEITGAHYQARQGHELGRDGIVSVRVEAPRPAVQIGGACVTCINGRLQT